VIRGRVEEKTSRSKQGPGTLLTRGGQSSGLETGRRKSEKRTNIIRLRRSPNVNPSDGGEGRKTGPTHPLIVVGTYEKDSSDGLSWAKDVDQTFRGISEGEE